MFAQQNAPQPAMEPQPYLEFQVEKAARLASGTSWPRYPAELRSAGVEGEVLVQFVVDTTGLYEPGTVKILQSSHELFTAAVRDALPSLKFSPAEIGGRKVRQIVQQPFTFNIGHK
jgi:protein TonB